MNDKEVLITILEGELQDNNKVFVKKDWLMKSFYKQRGKLGRTGKTAPLFYKPYKILLDNRVIGEEKRTNGKWVNLEQPPKQKNIGYSDSENHPSIPRLILIKKLKEENETMKRQISNKQIELAKVKHTLTAYISFLEDEIKMMRSVELNRLNREQKG